MKPLKRLYLLEYGPFNKTPEYKFIFLKNSVKRNPWPLERQKIQQKEEFKPKELQKGILSVIEIFKEIKAAI